MKDIALDPTTGDLLLENFDLQLVEGRDQIAQNLAIRLRFILGEWFLDITAGVPYYDDFFIKAPNQIRIESVLKEEILDTAGIDQILSFTSNFDAQRRIYSVTFSVSTIQGEIALTQELVA
jgi:hypothetical protein